ncbi:hypothetical protein NEIMUCOT_04830 [Neisseria mucosa ATCC 25996]|uniref:Uncharacterized protein n=1 Tax=Neisseria mucosa (strain ATCC 25996 / DSM 4631 / NCTC 10774 / M26) TaxID=546266 RepID=D2ZW38_NEIM2|nr:hypothetical protein NEIMUCOT_04830 [Neisseria mucosa ATCC 25996]
MAGVQLDHALVGCEPVGQVLSFMREVGQRAANQAFGGADGVQRVGFLGGKGGFADFDGVAFAVADDGGQGGAPVNIGQTNRAAAADGSNQAVGRTQVDADGETVLMRSGGHAGFGNLQKSHDCVPFDAVFIRIGRYFNRFRADS